MFERARLLRKQSFKKVKGSERCQVLFEWDLFRKMWVDSSSDKWATCFERRVGFRCVVVEAPMPDMRRPTFSRSEKVRYRILEKIQNTKNFKISFIFKKLRKFFVIQFILWMFSLTLLLSLRFNQIVAPPSLSLPFLNCLNKNS